MEIVLNGEPRDVAPGTTVADLVAGLHLPRDLVAVERNARIVPRARHAETALADGDRVEVVTLVGGG